MESLNLPAATEQHDIERKGEHSYWVVRYPGGPDGGPAFSRVVFFARSQQDAENYIRRYHRLQH